jgi:hypothetical protein
LAVARHLPHGRHQAGTATTTSTKPGTTSCPRSLWEGICTGIERTVDLLASDKSSESKVAAYTTASARIVAKEMADKLREYNPSLTREQALARTEEANPQLYQRAVRLPADGQPPDADQR